MQSSRLSSRSSLIALFTLTVAGACPLAAQQQTVTQFISKVEGSLASLTASLTPSSQPIILGGQEIFAYGSSVPNWPASVLIDYADGLKAAGVQRVEINPGVTTINNSVAVSNYDALVRHIRQLGMRLAINPFFMNGEIPVTSFQDFQNAALQTYPQLAARYQPDNFVIVHEPTTQAARMGITTTPAEWDAFIRTLEPLIKAASPRTLVGAGDCSHCNEQAFYADFVAIPTCTATNLTTGCLDFMTMDLYTDTEFVEDEGWAQAAHAANKGVYMEETFAPHYLDGKLSPGFQGSPTGAEGQTLIGGANQVFETLDQNWLLGMAQFASSYGMESITPFTTQTFFLYVSSGPDKATDPAYLREVGAAIVQGQLTPTATAYQALAQQYGIKQATSVSNASYGTLPTIFNSKCGTAANPCNANSTVAPDMLVSAFGANLANENIPASNFPNSLGNTTATLLDSTNALLTVPLYSVAPNQVNYLVPTNAAPGPATLTITSGDGTVTTGIVLVAPVAPGLYTSFATGQGPASAIAICTGTCSGWPNKMSNGQFWQYTFVSGCQSGTCTAPLTWGDSDTVVIELYGTGIRHLAQASDITANIGSTSVPVQFAGAQGTDMGLDQVNILIPQSLKGAGQVSLSITVSDHVGNVNDTSNAVTLDLQ